MVWEESTTKRDLREEEKMVSRSTRLICSMNETLEIRPTVLLTVLVVTSNM